MAGVWLPVCFRACPSVFAQKQSAALHKVLLPDVYKRQALALGMRTEASAKFEKGLDPLNTLPAVNRACELVEMLGAGEVLDGTIDILNYVPQPRVLKLEPCLLYTTRCV